MRIRPPGRPGCRGWRWRLRAESLSPVLPADQRFGMSLQIVREHAGRACGAHDLLERVAELLLARSLGADEGGVGVLEDAIGRGEHPARLVEGPRELAVHCEI